MYWPLLPTVSHDLFHNVLQLRVVRGNTGDKPFLQITVYARSKIGLDIETCAKTQGTQEHSIIDWPRERVDLWNTNGQDSGG